MIKCFFSSAYSVLDFRLTPSLFYLNNKDIKKVDSTLSVPQIEALALPLHQNRQRKAHMNI